MSRPTAHHPLARPPVPPRPTGLQRHPTVLPKRFDAARLSTARQPSASFKNEHPHAQPFNRSSPSPPPRASPPPSTPPPSAPPRIGGGEGHVCSPQNWGAGGAVHPSGIVAHFESQAKGDDHGAEPHPARRRAAAARRRRQGVRQHRRLRVARRQGLLQHR